MGCSGGPRRHGRKDREEVDRGWGTGGAGVPAGRVGGGGGGGAERGGGEVGGGVVRVYRREGWEQELGRVMGEGEVRGVVHAWSLDAAPVNELNVERLQQAQELGCGSLVKVVRAVGSGKGARLWVVTREA